MMLYWIFNPWNDEITWKHYKEDNEKQNWKINNLFFIFYLEISEVVLTKCNVVNNSYKQISRVLYTFIRYKSLGQLLGISRDNFMF